MARQRPSSLLLSLPVSLLAFNVACSSEEFVTAKGAALHQAEDCDDLLAQIQADAIAKLDQQAKMYQDSFQNGYYGGGGRGLAVGEGDGAVPGSSSGGTTSGAPSTDNSSEGGSEAPSSPSSHSETNTQVLGVDEADIVKNDGERIYLLHGTEFYILDSWPADETRVLGHTRIEGAGYELFVDGGKATLFSTVYPSDVPERGGAPAKNVDAMIDCYDCYGGTSFTKISVFDVTGNSPSLEREFLFEGNYVSARRHGDVVRTIVQGGFNAPGLYYPDIQTYDSFGNPYSDARIRSELTEWRDDVATDIRNTTLDDWIPRRFERKDGKLTELAKDCSAYYIPEPGRVQSGVSQVVTLDVQGQESPEVTSVLGGAQTVYANTTKLILSQTDWSYNYQEIDSTRSAMHQFVLDGAKTKYEASGFVPGYLVNQFAIDERRDVIRVTTTEDKVTDPNTWQVETINRVYQLGEKNGELKVLSKSEPIGDAGERIMSTRFVGDRAYVVTFLQTDPLIVVDVTNGDKTTVLGDIQIPGFSEYMHPLDGGHLLTIGQDGDANGTNGGTALQIFDVNDPTAPKLTFKEAFASSWSEASYNHKAFTFVANYFGEDAGLLLFPISSYDPEFKSTLAVVKVETNKGFTKLGSIDHTGLLVKGCAAEIETYGYCYSYYGSEMRRGLQIDEFIYAISYGGLTVQSLADLSAPVATIELPQPEFWGYGYAVEGGGVGGSTGSGTVDPAPDAGMGGASGL